MSRYLSFTSIIFLLLLVSCQKEKSFEQGKASKGSLQGNFGDCLSKKINGVYTATKSLADTNYIEVDVDVTQTGRYTIYTDTVNGYFFRATGTFSSIGSNTVHLKGFGTPGSAGTNDFIVFFDSSFCNLSVDVLPNSGSSGTALFALQGSGGNCMNAAVSGNYQQGVAITSSNKVTIEVNVTTPGTWIMGTNSVAGFSFNGSGNFTTAGVQTITLDGVGTPNVSGAQTFLVTAGTSSCSFSVTVAAGTATPSTDHFILTDNSWWSYGTPIPGDTLKRIIIPGAFAIAGISYKGMKEFDAADQIVDDTLFFRKSGNNYYEFNYVDYYTSFYLDNPIVDSILFLKEGLTTGQTWSSQVYTGTEGGASRKIRYDFKCDNNNATVPLNSKTYSNVYQITLKVMVDSGSGFVTDVTIINYYAQGIGWIYQKMDYGGGSAFEFPIRSYQVF